MHEFEGKESLVAKYDENVASQVQLDAALVEHYKELAIFFIFNEDPDAADLEAEKDHVHEESKKAYARAAERLAEDEANHPL